MKFALVSLVWALVVAGPGSAEPANSEAAAEGLLDFQAKRLAGPVEPLSQFSGQVLLVVNTASRCGYTGQYDGLQTLYDTYRERGFAVLGFPSNDFGRQEPGTDVQIGDFCRSNYGVGFPMFSKVRVGGPDAHPVYAYLTSLPEPIGGPVRWNFQKYLVDRSGTVIASFPSAVEPEDPRLVGEIERLLGEPSPVSHNSSAP